MRLAVLGATGRMGTAIIRLAAEDPAITLVGTFARPQTSAPLPDRPVCTTNDVATAMREADVVVDFTLPASMPAHLTAACAARKPYFTGITGLSAQDHQLLRDAAAQIPVLWSANTSIGITLLQSIVTQLAARLDTSFDIEILEMHHRDKQDAPSGTALMLGACAAQGRGRTLTQDEQRCRTAGRYPGEIGFSALRGGQVMGDCTVIFAGDQEVITLQHRALTRDVFAKGALAGAKWLAQQPQGLYQMSDVFSR